MKIGDIEVKILVAGEEDKEYPDPEIRSNGGKTDGSNSSVASVYIEAVPNASFVFKTTVHPEYNFAAAIHYLAVFYEVDGTKVRGRVLTREECAPGKPVLRDGHVR